MDATAFVFFVLAICLGSLYFGFRAVAWLFGELSGWHRMESPFGCDGGAPVWTHHGETIRIGAVRFRRCVSVGVQPDALYLRILSIFRFRPLRIPWNQMAAFRPDSVYGRPAMSFTAGGSTIVVEQALYAAMYPHASRAWAQTVRVPWGG